MCPQNLRTALGMAAISVAACAVRVVSLGNVGPVCTPPDVCGPTLDSSADERSPPDDSAPSNEGQATSDPDAVADSSPPADTGARVDSGHAVSTGTDGGAPDGPAGGNGISGNPEGTRPFATISNAWWIQYPDPQFDGGPVVSTVVYLFSKPVLCNSLSVPKWDESEPGDAQNLEIDVAWSGTTSPVSPPAVPYAVDPQVVQGSVPRPGMAGVFYQLAAAVPPAPLVREIAATGGTVTLTGLYANLNATGTFDLTFPNGTLTGTFDAAYCPNGREP
jgi:hypothetical protein